MAGDLNSSNATTNGTENDGTFIGNLLLMSKVGTPLYVSFILLPSLFLNGTVVLVFVKKKYARTPLNLLTINQCCAGIFSNFLNGFFVLIASPLALKHGSCDTGPPTLAIAIWTHYGMNALNLAAISVGIYVTLKYGNSFITYKKVLAVIVVIWVYPAVWGAMLAYIAKDYPSLTCEAYTGKAPETSTSGPKTYQYLPFLARDVLIDVVTRVTVAVFCIASYKLYRRNTFNPPEELKRRMLLLQVLMTSLLTVITLGTGVLLIGLNNGYGVTITADSPLVYIKDIVQLLVECDAIVYASLLLYLNTKLHRGFKEVLNDINFNCCKLPVLTKWHKRNRVLPLEVPDVRS